MKFRLDRTIEVLSATPELLWAMLAGLSAEWTGGPADVERKSWEIYDVIGHLIHGEETDWVPRAEIILAQAANRTFVPFDRFAQFDRSQSRLLRELLAEFERLRRKNLETLRSWDLDEAMLDLRGIHPEFGDVTLRHLLATWTVHDLNHIRQIATVMAKKYADEVGPWREYLAILT